MIKHTFVTFLLFVSCSLSILHAGTPKIISSGAKALATVMTYDRNGKMLGTATAFFAGNKGEVYTEYTIFKHAVRAEIIDATGNKSEVSRVCGANEIYDIVKLTVKSQNKASLSISKEPASVESKAFILSATTSKKPAIIETKISQTKTVSGGTYYTLSVDYKDTYVGAPVLDAKGEVVAIVQRNAVATDKATYAVGTEIATNLSVTALSYGDVALSTIYMPKQLPVDEKDATTYLYMLSQTTKDSLLYVTALNDFIEQHPQSTEGYIERAKFYGTTNKFAECEADITRAVELSPQKDNAHYTFSRIIYQNSLYNSTNAEAAGWSLSRALQEAQAAYVANPQPIYLLQQGDCYFGMKDYAAAADCYAQVNTSPIASAESFFYEAKAREKVGNSSDVVVALLDSALARFAKPYDRKAAPFLWERAEQLNAAGKYREAVLDYIEYEHVVGFQNLNDAFYYRREQAAIEGKMYKQAIDDIERAVVMKPDNYLYNVEKAALLVRLGQFDEAILSAQKAINLNNDGVDAYRIIGIAYGERKQRKLCIENLQKAKELGDEHAQELLEQYKK